MMRTVSLTIVYSLAVFSTFCILECNTDSDVEHTTLDPGVDDFDLTNKTSITQRGFNDSLLTNFVTAFIINSTESENLTKGNIEELKPTPTRGGPDRSIVNRGLVSKQTYDRVAEVITYTVVPLLIFAILFNIFNISVFGRKDMQTPSQAYLVSLSIVELLFSLLSSVPGIMQLMYGDKSTHTYVYLWYAGRISGFLIIGLRRSAYVLTLIMTLERFMAVAFPLKFRHFQLSRFPKALAVTVVLMILLFHLPKAFEDDIVAYTSPGSTEIKYRFQVKEFFKTRETLFDSLSLFNSSLFAYTPLFASVLLDILTIVGLKYHSRNQYITNSTTKSASMIRRERQMTTTLLASSVIFVLLSLPINCSSLVSKFADNYGIFQREHYLFFMMFRIGYITEVTSNCTDFIFCFILSSRFRGKFKQIYCPQSCREHKSRGLEGKMSSNSEATQEFGSVAAISST